MKEIDFTKTDWEDAAQPYEDYGKFSGLALARKHDLPTTERVWIYSGGTEDGEHHNMPSDEKLICRADAPIGKGNALPRGRDLYPEDIRKFYESLRDKADSPAVLAMRNPGTEIFGEYKSRYEVDGAAMIIVSPQKQIDVEYVGPGFDVGELTRGKGVHTSIRLPWEAVEEKPLQMMRLNRIGLLGKRYDIGNEEFLRARSERTTELRERLDETGEGIENAIPTSPTKLSPHLFRWIYQRCIMNTLFSDHPALSRDFGIMMNIYSTRLYVFEIWLPKRSGFKITT